MIRRMVRIGLLLGVLGAIAFLLRRLLGNAPPGEPAASTSAGAPWPRLTSDPSVPAAPAVHAVPDPSAPRPPDAASAAAWVPPADGVCPTSHPVKAKLSSKIFHLPGMLSYDRTNPDRCYADAAQAEADGLRPAKR